VIARRQLIIAFGAGAIAGPVACFGQQQGKVWRVGFLSSTSRPDSFDSHYYGAFAQGMQALGYYEGKNLTIDWRFADDKMELLAALAAELVQLNVDVIVTSGVKSVIGAVRKATNSIPVVIAGAADPVRDGFVKSLAHPGGNITGLSNILGDLGSKQLEMLLDMALKPSRLAVLVNPNASDAALKSVQSAGRRAGVTIVSFEAHTPQEIENAFSKMVRQKAGALLVTRDAFLNRQVRQIAELAAKNRLPTIAGLREFVEAGGLISYGSNLHDQFRRAATYVDKIFKGAKAGDLPIEQPTKFELLINGRTAKALGLKIPQSLLISADKVIE
jgi:putative ABC transport system substrate-binding protein